MLPIVVDIFMGLLVLGLACLALDVILSIGRLSCSREPQLPPLSQQLAQRLRSMRLKGTTPKVA